ncbi:MAG: CAP domain-containing protein, partial [Candidatus Micrarchaeaceae archaeon]
QGVKGYVVNVSPAALLKETNEQRATDQENQLTINSELAAAAQAKANDMVQRNYWSHVTPTGEQPWQFDTDAGYQYQSAGENLAYGFANTSEIMNAWMASTEHRDNILDKKYQNVGFGIANSPNYQGHGPATVVVAEYGQPLAPVATTASTPLAPTATVNAPASQPVARVQLLSGNFSYSVLLVVIIAGLAAIVFILRHGLAFRKLLVEGEEFVIHHGYLDIAAVAIAVAGILLTRTVGVIH